MQLGMIGLGRMGANMVRRLQRGGHQCVVFDVNQENVTRLAAEGATGSKSLDDFVKKLSPRRAVWLMLPAAVVDQTLEDLVPLLQKDDILIDGGNSCYVDDMRRAKKFAAQGIHYVDAGTSGAGFFVQCAIQSGLPSPANAVVSPSDVFQKFGDA